MTYAWTLCSFVNDCFSPYFLTWYGLKYSWLHVTNVESLVCVHGWGWRVGWPDAYVFSRENPAPNDRLISATHAVGFRKSSLFTVRNSNFYGIYLWKFGFPCAFGVPAVFSLHLSHLFSIMLSKRPYPVKQPAKADSSPACQTSISLIEDQENNISSKSLKTFVLVVCPLPTAVLVVGCPHYEILLVTLGF